MEIALRVEVALGSKNGHHGEINDESNEDGDSWYHGGIMNFIV